MDWSKAGVAIIVTLMVNFYGCAEIASTIRVAKCGPVYGNWCGEGYPTSGNDPDPVDEWDELCRDHDHCYDDGTDKEECDVHLVRNLESLSRERLAPLRMHNAHTLFHPGSQIFAWFDIRHQAWALFADCKGGDGVAATFYCQAGPMLTCPLNPFSGPGRAGMPCVCMGYPGIIGEN